MNETENLAIDLPDEKKNDYVGSDIEVVVEEPSPGSEEAEAPLQTNGTYSSQDAQERQRQFDESRYKRGKSHRETPRSDPNSRTSKLASENYYLQQQIATRDALYQTEIQKLQKELQNRQTHTHQLEEHSLKVQEEALKRLLRTAKEEGNPEAETEVQAALSKIHTDLSMIDIKKDQYRPYENPIPAYKPEPIVAQPPIVPAFQDFLDDNPWFNPNAAPHTTEFALTKKATALAQKLNEELTLRNETHLIDSPEYYGWINELMKNPGTTPASSQRPSMNSRYPQNNQPQTRVSGVNNDYYAPADARSRNGKGPVYLTPEEREVAMTMRKTHKDGRPYSDAELLQVYAKRRQQLVEHDKYNPPETANGVSRQTTVYV